MSAGRPKKTPSPYMTENEAAESQVMEVATPISEIPKPKYPYKDFLQKRVVRIEPILEREEFAGKTFESLPDGFIPPNLPKTLELPRKANTGGFVDIFDRFTKYVTPQFPEIGLTELEFFSKMKGRDLDTNLYDYNYWAGRLDEKMTQRNESPYTVKIPAMGMRLDLSKVDDAIAFKVIDACKGRSETGIAPSWAERKLKRYIFAIVDEKVDTDTKKEEINLKRKAMDEFNKIAESKVDLANFLIAYDGSKIPPSNATEEWLFTAVWKVIEHDPGLFLRVMNDPDKYDKLFIHNCCKAGVLSKNGDKYFTQAGEPLGKLGEVLMFIRNPERSDTRQRWEQQVFLDQQGK